jgi:hypothetical protein
MPGGINPWIPSETDSQVKLWNGNGSIPINHFPWHPVWDTKKLIVMATRKQTAKDETTKEPILNGYRDGQYCYALHSKITHPYDKKY